MKRAVLWAVWALVLAATAAFALQDDCDKVDGRWVCDYSDNGGPIADMVMDKGEFTVDITTPDSYMTWAGTYVCSENMITYTLETGSSNGKYDPEVDTIAVIYEEIEYVFHRVEGE